MQTLRFAVVCNVPAVAIDTAQMVLDQYKDCQSQSVATEKRLCLPKIIDYMGCFVKLCINAIGVRFFMRHSVYCIAYKQM